MEKKELYAFKEKIEKLQKQGYIPLTSDIPMDESLKFEDMSCGPENLGGVAMGKNLFFFDSLDGKPKPIEGGTEDLGYIPWGKGDDLPNRIYGFSESLPYTATALKFITDLTVGLGPKLMYRYCRCVSGDVKSKLIPYEDAGLLISEELDELRRQSGGDAAPAGDITWPEALRIASRAEPMKNGRQEKITALEQEYEAWKRTADEYREFTDNNNLDLHFLKCMIDDVHMDIYFPTVGLSRGRSKGDWNPKIVRVGHLPDTCVRLEEMDDEGRINYVYYSEKWRTRINQLTEIDSVAYPMIAPDNMVGGLREVVARNRRTRVKERPLWFCCPNYYPSMLKAYYPQPAWWSIFPSQVYGYASTLMFDKAAARKNATMWGKIIYINLTYLKGLYDQAGADTEEKQEEIKNRIFETVNDFLKNRANNGKTVMLESFLSDRQDQLWKSVEIVDVPRANTASATKEELEEISSILFFALGIHPALIGAVPGKSGSTGGTYQRELYLLKQQQVSPRQRIYLRFLQNIAAFNGWDTHAVWVIRQPVLTTLDRSATGLDEYDSH